MLVIHVRQTWSTNKILKLNNNYWPRYNLNVLHAHVKLVCLSAIPRCLFAIFMRPSSLGGGRIFRRTLSVCLSVRPVIITERHVAPPSELQWHTCTFRHALRAAYRTAISAAQILVIICFFNGGQFQWALSSSSSSHLVNKYSMWCACVIISSLASLIFLITRTYKLIILFLGSHFNFFCLFRVAD